MHFSDIHENQFKYNPSVITHIENMAFQLTYRNQWPGNSDFVTYDGAFIVSSEQIKSSFGIYLLRDTQGGGIINNTGVSLIYGYNTRIAHDLSFSAGLEATCSIYSTHFSGLTFENNLIPQLPLDQSIYFFNFASGFEISYRDRQRYGLAVRNLGALQSSQHTTSELTVDASYMGRFTLSGGYNPYDTYLVTLVNVSASRNNNELLYGGRIKYSVVYGGIYARQNIRFEFDALILLLGTQLGNVSIFYTYDLNLSGASARFSNLASHEVTFLYDMQYKRKSKKKGAIKCPKI